MPVDGAKEVAKVVVESSPGLLQWAVGGLGAGLAVIWGHITGRIKKMEETAVSAAALKEHIDEENEKFRELFTKHDGIIEKVSEISNAVARIEGALSNGKR